LTAGGHRWGTHVGGVVFRRRLSLIKGWRDPDRLRAAGHCTLPAWWAGLRAAAYAV